MHSKRSPKSDGKRLMRFYEKRSKASLSRKTSKRGVLKQRVFWIEQLRGIEYNIFNNTKLLDPRFLPSCGFQFAIERRNQLLLRLRIDGLHYNHCAKQLQLPSILATTYTLRILYRLPLF